MRKRHRKNGNKKFVYMLSFSLVFLFSIGYAAFNTTLTIKGKGNIKGTMKVEDLKDNLVTSGDGLYLDTTETDRYIYKGKSPNNYINFNEELWRIVAIESDNTLKIIKDEKLSTIRVFDSSDSETTGRRLNANNTYCRLYTDGLYKGCNAWNAVSGIYVNNNLNGTVTEDSEMKIYLNGEFYNGLNEYYKNKIQMHNFKKGGIAWGTVVESTKVSEEKDLWTGNIALLSLSDWYKASNNAGCVGSTNDWFTDGKSHEDYKCSLDNYLYREDKWWWLLSPRSTRADSVLCINVIGAVSDSLSIKEGAVHPVLFLKTNILLDKTTDGSMDNPYKIIG